MKFAYNSDQQLVDADTFEDGKHRDKIYRCADCNEIVKHTREHSRNIARGPVIVRAFFSHMTKTCNYDENNSRERYSNQMSEFHKNWQNIFPTGCREIRIGNNRADILLQGTESFNLVDSTETKFFQDFDPKNLVIEIQNSKISYDDLVKRQNNYKNTDVERVLMWIFNLQNTQCEIQRKEEKHILKYKDGDRSFMQLLNFKEHKTCILLDNGGTNLYRISNNPRSDIDYIELSLVDRIQLLEQLGNVFGLELKWEHEMKEDVVTEFVEPLINIDQTQEEFPSILEQLRRLSVVGSQQPNPNPNPNPNPHLNLTHNSITIKETSASNIIFDDNAEYEHIFSILNGLLPVENLEGIKECLYIMEAIHFKYFIGYDEYWKNDEGFVLVGEILGQLSGGNDYVMDIWINWVMKNKPTYRNRMPFGKYEGMMISEIPESGFGGLKWLAEDSEYLDNFPNVARRIRILYYFNEEILKSRFKDPIRKYTIRSMKKLYRDITGDEDRFPLFQNSKTTIFPFS